MSNDPELDQGLSAARAGQQQDAIRLLSAVVKREPNNLQAWIGLYNVVGQEHKKYCLERILKIDPTNQRALTLMARYDPPKKDRKPVITFALLVIFLLAVFGVFYVMDYAPKLAATGVCRVMVGAQLKSPSTAHFCQDHQSNEDGLRIVRGCVDSQNGFGATLRTWYTCKLQSNDQGGWTLQSLDFINP